MKFHQNKIILLFILLCTIACKKMVLTSEGKFTNEFDGTGRTYVFDSKVDSIGKKIAVNIPSGAVNHTSYLEFYQYKLSNANAVDSFIINSPVSDINLLISDGTDLLVPATIGLPFYFSPTFSVDSGYFPYRIKAESYSNIMTVLNDESKWEKITDFSIDAATQHLIFQTNNLQGIYVIARKK
jgi:hypothetical protein